MDIPSLFTIGVASPDSASMSGMNDAALGGVVVVEAHLEKLDAQGFQTDEGFRSLLAGRDTSRREAIVPAARLRETMLARVIWILLLVSSELAFEAIAKSSPKFRVGGSENPNKVDEISIGIFNWSVLFTALGHAYFVHIYLVT